MIKQKEITFQLIVEASPNALVLVNHEGKIMYLNHFAEKLFKYSKSELMGRDIEILIPERFKDEHPHFRSGFFKNPQTRKMGENRELYALNSEGFEFPVEVGLNPIVTAEGTMVLAAIIDISERKRAQKRFEMVVESAPNAIILVNPIGEMVLVNRQTEVLFGYTRDELMGKKIELLVPMRYKSQHTEYRTHYNTELTARAMGAGRDLFGLRKDGKEIPVEIGLNPIESPEGTLILASIIDISERKKGEEALKMYNKVLEEKNAEQEQLNYIVSHDLQEPLNSITSIIDLLVNEYQYNFDEKAKRSFNYITRSSLRMKSLITGLLDYGRIGGKNTILKEVDCTKLVELVCEDLAEVIKTTKAKIYISSLPVINAYELELRMLFQNLISNALKFKKPEAIPEIYITSSTKDKTREFLVTDNGIGIDPAFFDRIFNIFQRLHGTSEYEGTGIGLAHCKKIAELHNGEIRVQSQPGKGSTFSFTINT